jgi:hypothetical protein
VAGSPLNARAATWQVAQDWRPEADKLVSANNTSPANAIADKGCATAGGGADWVVNGVVDWVVAAPPPPQAAKQTTGANPHAARSHPPLLFEFIRFIPHGHKARASMRVLMLSRMIRICKALHAALFAAAAAA